jgi:hypothetical protein
MNFSPSTVHCQCSDVSTFSTTSSAVPLNQHQWYIFLTIFFPLSSMEGIDGNALAAKFEVNPEEFGIKECDTPYFPIKSCGEPAPPHSSVMHRPTGHML